MRPSRTAAVHATLGAVSVVMLVPFYWVLKTSLTGENIFQYPPVLLPRVMHPFYYVDVWYYIPFVRYVINSVIVSVIVVAVADQAHARPLCGLNLNDLPVGELETTQHDGWLAEVVARRDLDQ